MLVKPAVPERDEPKILALDTTSMHGSAAVLRSTKILAVGSWIALESHSSVVLPEIRACLQRAELSITDITHFVALVGPGSFTGIRIGLGTLQGLSMALFRPVLGVTVLEALAFSAPVSEIPVIATVDARREQVYVQGFQHVETGAKALEPPSCRYVEEWLATLERGALRFIGSGVSRYGSEIATACSSYQLLEAEPCLAKPAGLIGAERLVCGQTAHAETLDALYIRPPDIRPPKSAPVFPRREA